MNDRMEIVCQRREDVEEFIERKNLRDVSEITGIKEGDSTYYMATYAKPRVLSKEKIREEHLVVAVAPCTKHGSHYLTGTGRNKGDVQPLITEIVNDLPFYHECVEGEITGTYNGWLEVFRVKYEGEKMPKTEFGEMVRVDKDYVTKKIKPLMVGSER